MDHGPEMCDYSNALGTYFEASLLKGCTISKFHQWGLTCPGQGIHCAGERMPCSSLSHIEVYFTFFLLWGLKGSQES